MEYLIISNLYLALFYGLYKVCLAKETFFQLNRIYLLGTSLLALALPLIQLEGIESWLNASSLVGIRKTLDTVILGRGTTLSSDQRQLATTNWWLWIYLMGCAFRLGLLVRESILLRVKLQHPEPGEAYSFMRLLRVDPSQEYADKIIDHEAVHVRQKHSVDILLLEVLKIACWFNPVVYLLAKEVRLNHEYIADEQVNTCYEDKVAYAELLVSKALSTSPSVLSNPFLNPYFIKNRVMMLFKNKSQKGALLKYALILPFVSGMLVFSSAKVMKPSDGEQALMLNQSTPPTDTAATKVVDYNEVTTPPSFPGGIQEFYKWVGNTYSYPEEAVKHKIKGKVLVSFIIEADGTVKDVQVLEDLGYGTGPAAVEMLKKSPKWIPATKEGKKVPVAFSLPIAMNLTDVKQKEDPKITP